MDSDLDVSPFQKNPLNFRNLVQKFVEVRTKNNKVYEGTVFTIDPLSENVVLISSVDGKSCIDIIMSHAITSIKKSGQSPNFSTDTNLSEKILSDGNDLAVTLSDAEILKKKEQLKDWLSQNLISVSEEDNLLKLDDVLIIHPPYGVKQCSSNNQIVLSKVQALISKMESSS